jgi:shikimate kinase
MVIYNGCKYILNSTINQSLNSLKFAVSIMKNKTDNSLISSNLIVLIGYMGSGKSTVGALLADKRGILFFDLDQYMVEKHKNSIADLFSIHGEITFRKLEKEALQEVLRIDKPCVLSLGGGTPCYADNMKQINSVTSLSFYLAPSTDSLADRLFPEREKRPLISHLKSKNDIQEFVAKHIFERKNFYEQAAHTIRIKNQNPSEIVELIEKELD